MTAQASLQRVRVVCPRCFTTNRVPEARLNDGPKCGACKQALFDGRPAEVTGGELERYLTGSDLPIVVDFWAPWCGPCRAMAPVFEKAAKEFEPSVRFVKLNTDSDQKMAARLDIRGIPTLILFKHGKEIARTAGAMDAGRFRAWVHDHAE